jgi:8-oxo-dGTP diphosphatase
MARVPVLAAGGIVLRREKTPRIAVVRLRKRNEWVLPKGKLDDGETPRAAAMREAREETGHAVLVHEFLGTLVYETAGGSKVVHYWRMEADDEPAYPLMPDVRAVEWLPLGEALQRLSRAHERVFLENVGPIALQAATLADGGRRSKAKAGEKPVTTERRRPRRVAPAPEVSLPVAVPSAPELAPDMAGTVVAPAETVAVEGLPASGETAEAPVFAAVVAPAPVEAELEPPSRGLLQRFRNWLRREA